MSNKQKTRMGKKGIVPLAILGSAASAIVGGVGSALSGAGNIISSFPAPIKFILFMFILVFAGDFMFQVFVGGNYECTIPDQGKVVLLDVGEYNECVDHFGVAWSRKHNILGTITASDNLTDLERARINLTIANAIGSSFDIVWGSTTGGLSDFWDNFGFFWENKSIDNFRSAVANPDLFACQRLDKCLSDVTSITLGLSNQCSNDQVPEWAAFEDATRLQRSEINPLANEDGVDWFGVSCSTTFTGKSRPTPTFFGIQFLNVQLIMLVFLLGAAVVGYGHLRRNTA